MKLSQYWSKKQREVVLQQPKQRMLALFKQLIHLLETIHVVSIKVGQHFLTTKLHILKHFVVFLPSEIDSEQSTVDVIISFSQNGYYLMELR
jgi:hypothetical protein